MSSMSAIDVAAWFLSVSRSALLSAGMVPRGSDDVLSTNDTWLREIAGAPARTTWQIAGRAAREGPNCLTSSTTPTIVSLIFRAPGSAGSPGD